MGWGPDPEWGTANVVTNEKACNSGMSVVLTVEVNAESAEGYKVPGQYVQVRLDDSTKPLFLAIASPPGSGNTYEFLIKKTEGNEWMTSLSPGTEIQVSQVMGGGFPIEENLDGFKYDFPTQNVLLFAAGSGLAPIKAAIESDQLKIGGDSSRTARLYYGERTADDLCYVDQFQKWESKGLEVIPVLSDPDTTSWQGRTGYVQNALEEDGIPVPRNSGALLCGMKGMTESVKDMLVKSGMFEGRVMFNF